MLYSWLTLPNKVSTILGHIWLIASRHDVVEFLTLCRWLPSSNTRAPNSTPMEEWYTDSNAPFGQSWLNFLTSANLRSSQTTSNAPRAKSHYNSLCKVHLQTTTKLTKSVVCCQYQISGLAFYHLKVWLYFTLHKYMYILCTWKNISNSSGFPFSHEQGPIK